MKNAAVYEMQKARVQRLISSGEIDEINGAIGKLPISGREKIVLRALLSKELVNGQLGNTAEEILREIRRTNDGAPRGSKIGIKIWAVLNKLEEERLIQIIEGFPKLYVLNRELNPIDNITYSYSILEALYDVLPELKSFKSEVSFRAHSEDRMRSPSSGAYSTNEEYIRELVEMIDLSKKELIGTSLSAQSFEEYPIFVYALGNALERGVKVYYLLSDRTSHERIDCFKKIGANVKVVESEALLQHGIPNIVIVDRSHFMEVNRYEQEEEKRIRFGVWYKYNKMLCANYIEHFWKLWESRP